METCRKEGLHLIRADPEFHPDEMKMMLQERVRVYSPFWIENNVTKSSVANAFGFKTAKGQKLCNKLDNITFAIQTTSCDDHLGFICEKALSKGRLSHQINNTEYFIEPQAKYSCSEAEEQCRLKKMTLVVRQPYSNNTKLQEFVFLNFGNTPSFWFKTANTSGACIPLDFMKRSEDTDKHGFICEKPVVKRKMTERHWVLIASTSTVVVIAIIVLVVYKTCTVWRAKWNMEGK
ncbi:uncharacterized protein LOC101895978 [Musca domestica]|uniref:Uncharacterized protein LOC101895978 n=1 Tax=Musca domestica TaxID=7370 RepID=A0A1I8MAQ5_MUSDO|nr:uncharacterized protein LOC101895978 [Musca domestica]